MRPVNLTIEGLTSIRDAQHVDLSEFDLFAITGPTGSGKTSILDAITFALYGDIFRVKGGEIRDLISHGSAQVKVALDFDVDGVRYRVARRMKRAGAQDATLERIENGGPVPEVDAGGVRAVNNRIEEILGLDYATFTKAVLLPQGAFQEFLRGDQAARRKILVSLLDLGRYAQAGAKARERHKTLDILLEHKQKQLDTDYADATEEQRAELQLVQVSAAQKSQALEEAQSEAREKLSVTRALTEQINQVSRADPKLQDAGTKLACLGAALPDLETREREAALEMQNATSAVKDADESLAAARAAQAQAHERFGDEASLTSLLFAAETAKTETNRLTETSKMLADARDRLTKAHDRQTDAQKALEDAAATLDLTARKRLETDQAFEHAKLLVRCSLLHEESAALAARLETQTKAVDQQKLDERRAKEHWQHIQRQNLAISIRGDLSVGTACPVCESIVATLPDGNVDTVKLLAGAQAGAEQAEQTCRALERCLDELGSELKRVVVNIEEARASLPDVTDIPDSKQTQEALEHAARYRDEIASAYLEAERAVNRAREENHQAELQLQESNANVATYERDERETSGRLGEATAKLRAVFRPEVPENAAGLFNDQLERLKSLRKCVLDAERNQHQARQAEAHARTDQEAQAKEAAEFTTDLGNAKYAIDLAEQMLVESAGSAPAAKLPQEPGDRAFQINTLLARIATLAELSQNWTHDRRQELELASIQLSRLAQDFCLAETPPVQEAADSTQGQASPATHVAATRTDPEDIVKAVERSCKIAGEVAVLAKANLAALDEKITKRKDLEATMAGDKAKSGLLRQLAQELREDHFVTFVLSESMQRLSELATKELAAITSGRYSMVNKDVGFEVVDHFNADEKRSVATLSGGETFLASLALALALAGSVRDMAGTAAAAKLESIFIDEGFGALDPESLDIAVDALEAIGQGERMVGVISHVPALAERIPSGLILSKTGTTTTIGVR
jgi:exonuclease SbcC